MIIKRSRNLIASLVFLFPLSATAQETPKLEIFEGYSYLRLTEQPRTRLESAGLNGWNASVKLNVTRRIGLLADFSGNYGQRELTELTVGRRVTTPIRHHTYLFGPEVRVLNSG